MASPTQWIWVWVNSGSWWWTGRPGMLRFIGSQRVRHDWTTEPNWTDDGNLISGSFAFSKSSLNIWKFMVHIPLKSGLESSAWEDCDCAVVWPFFGLASFWDWNETDLFQSCGYCWVFPICWNIGCSTCTASSFRIWNNSSIGIPSSLLALFVVMLPKAHLTAHSRMSDSRWVITPSCLSGSLRLFFV